MSTCWGPPGGRSPTWRTLDEPRPTESGRALHEPGLWRRQDPPSAPSVRTAPRWRTVTPRSTRWRRRTAENGPRHPEPGWNGRDRGGSGGGRDRDRARQSVHRPEDVGGRRFPRRRRCWPVPGTGPGGPAVEQVFRGGSGTVPGRRREPGDRGSRDPRASPRVRLGRIDFAGKEGKKTRSERSTGPGAAAGARNAAPAVES